MLQPAARNGFYRDIAVVAYRKEEANDEKRPAFSLRAESSQSSHTIDKAGDGDVDTFWVSSGVKPGQGPSADHPIHVVASFDSLTVVSGFSLTGRTAVIRFDPVKGRYFRLELLDAYDDRYPEAPRNVQIAEFAL